MNKPSEIELLFGYSRSQRGRLSCHSGNIRVGKTGRTTLWAGGKQNGVVPTRSGINLALGVEPIGIVSFHNTHTFSIGAPTIAIQWSDGFAGSLNRAEWFRLAAELRKYSDVVMYCMGGHGRTGTALTILSSLMGISDDQNCPVMWMRKHYCTKAVENMDQIEYIESILQKGVSHQAIEDTLSMRAYLSERFKEYFKQENEKSKKGEKEDGNDKK